MSISMSVASNALVVATHPLHRSMSTVKKSICVLVAPFAPAATLLNEMAIKIRQANCIKEIKCSVKGNRDASISKYREGSQKLASLFSLTAELKVGENVVEQFPQFVIFILVALITFNYRNATVANLGALFIAKTVIFLIISACVSFMSMIWGHLNYVAAKKNGFIPLVGKILLLTYFTMGSSVRVIAAVLLFTPFLGLFDTMSNFRLAKIEFSADEQVFGEAENGTALSLREDWNQYYIKDLEKFLMVPTFTPIIYILVVVAAHLGIACLLLRETEKSKVRLFQLGIFTLVCPPIFADWEEFRVAIR